MTYKELIQNLEVKNHFILAIDGKCGSGKTTLADDLAKRFHANVFHLDDFYLPADMRTVERLEEIGGNVHYERFLETVLMPLMRQETVYYQPFDCSTMTYKEVVEMPYSPFNIIEGSYALRTEFINMYTDIVVLYISSVQQIERLTKRNPDKVDDFINKWIPLENKYFEYYHIYEKYSVISL